MSEPKRYSVCHINEKTIEGYFVTCKAGTIEHPEGAMVYYEDYALLKADAQNLRHQAVHDVSQLGEQSAEIAHLKAEVERLRKAGDALAKRTEFFQKRWDADELCQEVELWNAAKEGKPSV